MRLRIPGWFAWKPGDQVELTMPMRLRVEAHIVGPNFRVEVPAFHAKGPDPASWIQAAGSPLTFRTAGQRKDVALLPLNRLYDRRYSVYWQVT